jgi:hypothetical protein
MENPAAKDYTLRYCCASSLDLNCIPISGIISELTADSSCAVPFVASCSVSCASLSKISPRLVQLCSSPPFLGFHQALSFLDHHVDQCLHSFYPGSKNDQSHGYILHLLRHLLQQPNMITFSSN